MSDERTTQLPPERFEPHPLNRTGMICSRCRGDVEVQDIRGNFARRVYHCRKCGATKCVETAKDQVTIEMGQ